MTSTSAVIVQNPLMVRFVRAGLILLFFVILAELSREVSMRDYTAFGIWQWPGVDIPFYGGIVLLAVIVFVLRLIRSR